MTKHLTYHGKPELKAKILAGYKAHMDADTLIEGEYFTQDGGVFKGCHIGCVVHDIGGDHKDDYERLTGLPNWLRDLTERFHENMPRPQNQQAGYDILAAVPVGKDIAHVKHQFLIWLLSNETHGTIQYCDKAGQAATLAVVYLHKRALNDGNPSEGEWAAASAAAGDAGSAAAWAAASAAAGAAASAAAWTAARDAARDAAWAAQVASLIKFLSDSE